MFQTPAEGTKDKGGVRYREEKLIEKCPPSYTYFEELVIASGGSHGVLVEFELLRRDRTSQLHIHRIELIGREGLTMSTNFCAFVSKNGLMNCLSTRSV